MTPLILAGPVVPPAGPASPSCDLGHTERMLDCHECWWLQDHDAGCEPDARHTATCCAVSS